MPPPSLMAFQTCSSLVLSISQTVLISKAGFADVQGKAISGWLDSTLHTALHCRALCCTLHSAVCCTLHSAVCCTLNRGVCCTLNRGVCQFWMARLATFPLTLCPSPLPPHALLRLPSLRSAALILPETPTMWRRHSECEIAGVVFRGPSEQIFALDCLSKICVLERKFATNFDLWQKDG